MEKILHKVIKKGVKYIVSSKLKNIIIKLLKYLTK